MLLFPKYGKIKFMFQTTNQIPYYSTRSHFLGFTSLSRYFLTHRSISRPAPKVARTGVAPGSNPRFQPVRFFKNSPGISCWTPTKAGEIRQNVVIVMEPEIHEAEKIDDLPAALSQVVKYMRESQRCQSNIMVSFQVPHHWIMVKPCETPIHITLW